MDAKVILSANFDVARRFSQRMLSRFDRVDASEREKINHAIPGYSTSLHWRFFKKVMSEHKPDSMAIAGVFHGRDCAYLKTLAAANGNPEMSLTGVDLFADEALPDWSAQHEGKSWEENGFGPAPTIEGTRSNLAKLSLDRNLQLFRQDAITFFESDAEQYDFIYIDTSHDYQTTYDTILAAMPRLKNGGIIAGDDYLDFGMWGVKSAVAKALPDHQTYASDFIWYWQAGK